MNIGYVGLGDMGGALAQRLQLTHDLVVYDLDTEKVHRLVQRGAVAGESLTDVASHCDVILLCLPTSEHVRSVIFGENGLAHFRRGTLVIDQSTGDPAITRVMAAELEKRGVELVDAPVSGGPQGAEAGNIAIMVGANPEQFKRAHSILAAITPNIFHAGGIGSGQVMKLVNNMLSGAQRLLSMECLALAAKSGIDPAKAVEILLAGGARNVFLEKAARPLLKGEFGAGFTLGLMHKDIRLACQMGSEFGVPLFFGTLTREFYQMCLSERGAADKVNTAALVMDRLAGTHLVPSAS